MDNPIVSAIIEDDDFQQALEEAVQKALTTDDLPLAEQIDQAISEHDTVLNLVKRVEELEQAAEDGKNHWKGLEEATKPEASADLEPVVKDMELVVVGDEKGGQFLARNWDGSWQVQHLYAVTYRFPIEMGRVNVTKYVIAESIDAAVGQGTCGLKLEREECEQIEKTATGAQLPLMLRGWSGQTF